MQNIYGKQKNKLNELAKRIRSARVEARLSQNALGKLLGVSDKSISAYEQGRSMPPFEKIKKIAESTNHPISYFTEDNNNEAVIATKILSIERELSEVKKLLKASQK